MILVPLEPLTMGLRGLERRMARWPYSWREISMVHRVSNVPDGNVNVLPG